MALKVPEADRIKNRFAPINPADKTELNADNVMLILDKLIDGLYRYKMRVLKYSEMQEIPDKEAGEVFFASDIKQFMGWDGTKWLILGEPTPKLVPRSGTYSAIQGWTDKVVGEIFFATDLKQFVGWNGVELVILG